MLSQVWRKLTLADRADGLFSTGASDIGGLLPALESLVCGFFEVFGADSLSLTSMSIETGIAGAVSEMPPIASFTELILAGVFSSEAVASFSDSSSACHRLVVHGPVAVGEAVALVVSLSSSPTVPFCSSSLLAAASPSGE